MVGSLAVSAGAKRDSVVRYVECYPVKKDTLKAFLQQKGVDGMFVDMMEQNGFYFPNDSACTYTAPVYPPLQFNYSDIVNSLKQPDEFSALYQFTVLLYKLIPDAIDVADKPYDFEKLAPQQIFDSLKLGAWAFICDGHAKTAEYYINHLAKNRFTVKVVSLDPDSGDVIPHALAFVYYKHNNQWYGLTLDCQNGKLGPIIKDSNNVASISELEVAAKNENADGKLSLLSLQDYTLHRKRTFVDRPMPCNLYPDKSCEYHVAYKNSGLPLERLSYSNLDITWFKRGFLDIDDYTNNLIKLLVKHAPEQEP